MNPLASGAPHGNSSAAKATNPWPPIPVIFLMRPSLLAVCLLLLLAAIPFAAHAQQDTSPTLPLLSTSPTRVAFVDIEIVLDSSAAIRQIITEVDSELGQQSKAIDDKRREARRITLSLEQQGSVLSETERQTRQQRAADLMNEVDEMEYRFQREVKERQRTTIEPILEKVIRMIGDVGRREGFDLVVRGENVLYGRDTVDLTPYVIREVDKRVDELRKSVEKAAGPKAVKPTPKPLPLIP